MPDGSEVPTHDDGLVPTTLLTMLQDAVDANAPDLNVRVGKRLGTAATVILVGITYPSGSVASAIKDA